MHRCFQIGLFLALTTVACERPYKNVPPAPPSTFARGERLIEQGEYPAAIEEYKAFLEKAQDPTFRARAFYQLARAYYQAEQYQATIDTLDSLETEYPNERWPQTAALRGDAQFKLGYRTEAFLAWEQAWARGNPADQGVLRERIEKAAPDLTPQDVLELNELVTLNEVREVIALHAPALPPPPQVAVGEILPGEEGLIEGEELAGEASPGFLEEIKEAPTADLEEPGFKVACLLPLTGPDTTYGARALSGLRLAFADSSVRLVVRDTGGDPEMASRILTDLAANPSVLAAIGPLRANEAEKTAPLADRLGIPLLLLSQREGLDGEYALQASMTRPQQVRALVQHAMRTLDAKRFGVIYPDDNYGRTFTRLFTAEVQRRGGRVVGTRAYSPGQSTFLHETGTAQRWASESRVDAVFIPDAAESAVRLAVSLRRAIPSIGLLGTEAWNRPELLAVAGPTLNGALFADAFHAAASDPATQDFVTRFQDFLGRPPTVFEAQAYDSGMLARKAIEGGSETRTQVLSSLRNVGTYSGAGRVFGTAGNLERDVFVLQVRDGSVQEVGRSMPPPVAGVAAPASVHRAPTDTSRARAVEIVD